MQFIVERGEIYPLRGIVQADDSYLCGKNPGGKLGRGSENKVPFAAAVSIDLQGYPIYARFTAIQGFTSTAIEDWVRRILDTECQVLPDGPPFFNGIADAGGAHAVVVAGCRKPLDLHQFCWVNTVLCNLKTGLSGAYHAFKFRKYAQRYLSTTNYRFNRHFKLGDLAPECTSCRRQHRTTTRALAPCSGIIVLIRKSDKAIPRTMMLPLTTMRLFRAFSD